MILDDKHIKVMIQAAKEAGAILLEGYGQMRAVSITYKDGDSRNLVTEYDVRAEKAIIEALTSDFPKYGIVAEESAPFKPGDLSTSREEYIWVIDPLDGTTNFTYKRPHFCTSIGLAYKGVPIAGVIYNPVLDELFYAAKDKGAYLNGHKIRVSGRQKIEESLIHVSINRLSNPAPLQKLLDKAAEINRFGGSAALDLAWIATGRIDAWMCPKLSPWDVAAGSIIVQEAGGVIMGVDGNPHAYLTSGHIIAGSKALVASIMDEYLPGIKIDGIQFGLTH